MPGYDLRGIKGDSLPYGKASEDGEIDNTEVFSYAMPSRCL